jgi:hypothetical protein
MKIGNHELFLLTPLLLSNLMDSFTKSEEAFEGS